MNKKKDEIDEFVDELLDDLDAGRDEVDEEGIDEEGRDDEDKSQPPVESEVFNMDREALLKAIEEEGVDIEVTDETTDDELRIALMEARGELEEEPVDVDDLDTMSRAELKKIVKEEEIPIKIYKGITTDDEIREAIRKAREEKKKGSLDEELEKFRRELDEYAAKVMGLGQQQGNADQFNFQPQQQQQQIQQPKIEVSQEEIDEALQSPEKFNELLSKVIARSQEVTLQNIVPLMGQMMSQQLALKTLIDDFYADNPDLRPYRRLVGLIATQVQSNHPDWPYERILMETEKISRERLKMPKTAGKNESKKQKRVPVFAGVNKSSRTTKRNTRESKLQKELDELLTGVV